MHKIICLTGPSGIGKTSYALRLISEKNFASPVVYTTRLPRADDDSRYVHIKDRHFKSLVKLNAFIEFDKYLNWYYGTSRASLEKLISNPDIAGVVLDLTPSGCLQVRREILEAIIVALVPDNQKWLEDRLKLRHTQSQREIKRRTQILISYLRQIELLDCVRVIAKFSQESWDSTFRAILQAAGV